jgi:nucleoside-diphosphate-sugar epimerase
MHKILITGNLGYIGPVLTNYLKKKYKKKISITGLDNGYFKNFKSDVYSFEKNSVDIQIYEDLRSFKLSNIVKYDSIVLLAAISNDPIGNSFIKQTYDINIKSNLKLIKEAIKKNVKNIVFAGSCSIYGNSGHLNKKSKKENDELNPLTPYAISKVEIEKKVKLSDLKNTVFTSLRFATACGVSSGLRLDLALNEMVWSSVTKKQIKLQSDGSQFRPLIDVSDMCRAIDWAVFRKKNNGGKKLEVNVGNNKSNIRIIDIANKIKSILPKTKILKKNKAYVDKRSYKVDFKRYYDLAKNHRPKKNLDTTIKELAKYIKNNKFSNEYEFEFYLKRLNLLNEKIRKKILNKNLDYL